MLKYLTGFVGILVCSSIHVIQHDSMKCKEYGGAYHIVSTSLNEKIKRNGTSLIIGAHTGAIASDFVWTILSEKSASIEKIFVEPIPFNFMKLKQNAKTLANTKLIQAAAVTDEGVARLSIFCTGVYENGTKVNGFPWWTDQICSTNRDRLFHEHDINNSEKLTKERIEEHIIKYDVPAIAVSMLFREHVTNEILFFSCDVEGLDHMVR